MPTSWLLVALALFAGTLMPTQAAVNNRLALHVQSPLLAAFISFAVGTLALLLLLLLNGVSPRNLELLRQAPPLTWSGGLCGAFFVMAAVILTPRLGVALTFSMFVAGQMLATLPIDHFGFLGAPVREINWPRVLGVLCVVAGVVLIRRF